MSAAGHIAWLEAGADPAERVKLARYGIRDATALGIPMGAIKKRAKATGFDHPAALALWADGRYEARLLAVHLANPAAMDPAVMQSWAEAFDNWAICDTACFQLFDKTDARWDMAERWCADDRLYVRRAGLAMIWALSVHDKAAADAEFETALGWIASVAEDDRDHVAKAADMALRATGKRNRVLNAAALALCDKLDDGGKAAQRLARKARRELRSDKVQAKL